MPLPDIPSIPVDGDFIETEWGDDVARLLSIIANAPDGPNQIAYFPTSSTFAALAAPGADSVLHNGPAGVRYVPSFDTEEWAKVGGPDVPPDRQEKQIRVSVGATLPAAGPAEQLTIIAVPASAAVSSQVSGGSGLPSVFLPVVAADGRAVTFGSISFGNRLTTHRWQVATESFDFTGSPVSIAGGVDTQPVYQTSLAVAGAVGFFGGEDGEVFRFNISGSGQWSQSGSTATRLGVANRGMALDSDGSRLYYAAKGRNNSQAIVSTDAVVRSTDLSLTGDRAEFTQQVTELVALAATPTRIYLLDLIEKVPDTAANSDTGRYELLECDKSGTLLSRIPFEIDGLFSASTADQPYLYDITAVNVDGSEHVYMSFRQGNIYYLREAQFTPGELHVPGVYIYESDGADQNLRIDITRTVIDAVESGVAVAGGLTRDQTVALLAPFALRGSSAQVPVSQGEDIIQAAVDRVGPVTGLTAAQVDDQIDAKVPPVFRTGNAGRLPDAKAPSDMVTGIRLDSQNRLVADKNGDASDAVTLPQSGGGGTDPEEVNRLITEALVSVRSAIGTNTSDIASLTAVVTANRQGLASLEGRFDAIAPDNSSLDSNERYLAAVLRLSLIHI